MALRCQSVSVCGYAIVTFGIDVVKNPISLENDYSR